MVAGWVLEARLGSGAWGEVWKARRQHVDLHRALKLQRLVSDTAFTGWREEALRLESLSHPNIVRFYDADIVADGPYRGWAWIATELCDGSLADELAGWPTRRLSDAQCEQLVEQMLSALGAAHAGGCVHRDVKPANILRHASGAWKLADFGTARLVPTDDTHPLTGVVGTLPYMSPGACNGRQDHAADLYALGVTLHECLTGRRLHVRSDRSDGQYLQLILHEPPAIDSTLPTRWRTVIEALIGTHGTYDAATLATWFHTTRGAWPPPRQPATSTPSPPPPISPTSPTSTAPTVASGSPAPLASPTAPGSSPATPWSSPQPPTAPTSVSPSLSSAPPAPTVGSASSSPTASPAAPGSSPGTPWSSPQPPTAPTSVSPSLSSAPPAPTVGSGSSSPTASPAAPGSSPGTPWSSPQPPGTSSSSTAPTAVPGPAPASPSSQPSPTAPTSVSPSLSSAPTAPTVASGSPAPLASPAAPGPSPGAPWSSPQPPGTSSSSTAPTAVPGAAPAWPSAPSGPGAAAGGNWGSTAVQPGAPATLPWSLPGAVPPGPPASPAPPTPGQQGVHVTGVYPGRPPAAGWPRPPAMPNPYANLPAAPAGEAVVARRIAAALVDLVIVFFAMALLWDIGVHLTGEKVPEVSGDDREVYCEGKSWACLTFHDGDSVWVSEDGGVLVLGYFLPALLSEVVLQGLTGWTLGKRMLGLRLVRSGGRTPGVGVAFARSVARVVDLFPCCFPIVGLVMVLSTEGHRTVADTIARTWVVRRSPHRP